MNWLRRHLFDHQMTQDPESIRIGHTAAIAAAAFAIQLREDAEMNGSKPPQSSKVKRRYSFKKTRSTGENSVRHPAEEQNHQALTRDFLARKSSRSSSNNSLKNPEFSGEKAERNDTLKSFLSWSNGNRTKATQGTERNRVFP